MARSIDKYANILTAKVATAGATDSSVEVQTGVSLGQGRGIIIDSIEYLVDSTVLADFVAGATGDLCLKGWFTTSPTAIGDYDYTNSRLIHMDTDIRIDIGTAGSGGIQKTSIVYQFFPPLIVAVPKLYFATRSTAAIDGGNLHSRIYFRYVDLTAQEYLEIAETFVLTS